MRQINLQLMTIFNRIIYLQIISWAGVDINEKFNIDDCIIVKNKMLFLKTAVAHMAVFYYNMLTNIK